MSVSSFNLIEYKRGKLDDLKVITEQNSNNQLRIINLNAYFKFLVVFAIL